MLLTVLHPFEPFAGQPRPSFSRAALRLASNRRQVYLLRKASPALDCRGHAPRLRESFAAYPCGGVSVWATCSKARLGLGWHLGSGDVQGRRCQGFFRCWPLGEETVSPSRLLGLGAGGTASHISHVGWCARGRRGLELGAATSPLGCRVRSWPWRWACTPATAAH